MEEDKNIEAILGNKRKQLFDCLSQLAERAYELDEKPIAIAINTLCGCILSGDDTQFMYMCEAFSRMKLDQLEKEQATMDKLLAELTKEKGQNE
jgi:uncharacterized protein (UPF0297 family)